MPRWKAWQCRFGMPGIAKPATCCAPSRGAFGVTRAIAPPVTSTRTSRAQPEFNSA